MTINVKRKEQPIAYVELARKGFAKVRVSRTEDGLVRIKAQKDGVQGYLFSDKSAAELIEALKLITDAA